MSFGYPYITNVQGCIHDGWLVIRTPETMLDKLYLHTVFLSDHAKAVFLEAASGAVVQNLNADKARLLPVPLPPLAEQHRIVAKVDELMALCDRLEAARNERESRRDRLGLAVSPQVQRNRCRVIVSRSTRPAPLERKPWSGRASASGVRTRVRMWPSYQARNRSCAWL